MGVFKIWTHYQLVDTWCTFYVFLIRIIKLSLSKYNHGVAKQASHKRRIINVFLEDLADPPLQNFLNPVLYIQYTVSSLKLPEHFDWSGFICSAGVCIYTQQVLGDIPSERCHETWAVWAVSPAWSRSCMVLRIVSPLQPVIQAEWLDVLTSLVKDCLLPLFLLHCKRGQAAVEHWKILEVGGTLFLQIWWMIWIMNSVCT